MSITSISAVVATTVAAIVAEIAYDRTVCSVCSLRLTAAAAAKGGIPIAIQVRFEYDSSAIRARFESTCMAGQGCRLPDGSPRVDYV